MYTQLSQATEIASQSTSYIWSTKLITEWLIAVISVVILVLLITIALATAINRTEWWNKRRRACQRRLDSQRSRNDGVQIEDKLFQRLCQFVEAVSFRRDSEPLVASKSNITKTETRPSNLPLRFQPEKLYGTVSTVHRDNLRKKSCMNLSVPTGSNSVRRSSMVDTLLSWKSPLQTSFKSNDPVENKYSGIMEPGINNLPHIDITCVADDSESGMIYDSTEKVRSSVPHDCLTINLPVRRASSTNFELSATRSSKTSSTENVNFLSAGDRVSSDVESITSMRRRSTLRGIHANAKRSSLWDTFSLASQKADKRLLTMQNQQTKILAKVKASEQKDSDLTTSTAIPSNEPSIMSNLCNLFGSAGVIALSINVDYGSSESGIKFIVSLVGAKGLKSRCPWKKSSYVLKFNLQYGNLNQQASVTCKAAEFGILRFRSNPKLLFGRYPFNSLQGLTGDLDVQVVELISQWSGAREHYHGSVSITLDDNSLHETLWHPIDPAYPIIRIKADALVSLRYCQMEGLLSLGVQEIRNFKLVAFGPWALDKLHDLIDTNQMDLDVHACLVCDGHLVKAKKCRFLKRQAGKNTSHNTLGTNYGVPPPSPIKASDDSVNVGKSLNFARWTGDEHNLQFALPRLKGYTIKQTISNIGIAVFINYKMSNSSWLPAACVQSLRSAGLVEEKHFNLLGECFIGSAATQLEYRRENNLPCKADAFSAKLWNEAVTRSGTRVYQWLSVE